jgi:hypothetical protein
MSQFYIVYDLWLIKQDFFLIIAFLQSTQDT